MTAKSSLLRIAGSVACLLTLAWVTLLTAQRKPATPANNPTAAYCLNAYMAYTGRTLDVYDNDSEIRYVLDMCAPLEVIRQAMVAAGPNLTDKTFIQGLYSIKGMQTSEWPSVSFPTSLARSMITRWPCLSKKPASPVFSQPSPVKVSLVTSSCLK